MNEDNIGPDPVLFTLNLTRVTSETDLFEFETFDIVEADSEFETFTPLGLKVDTSARQIQFRVQYGEHIYFPVG